VEEKPFLGIRTIDRDLLESVRQQNGRLPDNFVDSAEGASPAIPSEGELLSLVDEAATALAAKQTDPRSDAGPNSA
jgi:hypothetical protein